MITYLVGLVTVILIGAIASVYITIFINLVIDACKECMKKSNKQNKKL